MTLLWPGFLLLLGLVPLIIGVYIWMLRRRRVALRYSSLSLVRAALPRYSHLRRHLPFALFLLALASLIVALGRPVQIVSVPSGQATIILALDASWSMRQTDIAPSRLQAAQAAALSFIHNKPTTQIGLVALPGTRTDPASNIRPRGAANRGREPEHGARDGDWQRYSRSLMHDIADIDPNVAPSVDETSSGLSRRRCQRARTSRTSSSCSPDGVPRPAIFPGGRAASRRPWVRVTPSGSAPRPVAGFAGGGSAGAASSTAEVVAGSGGP